MKDLGLLYYFLGLEVHQSPKCLFVNQYKYTSDLIELADLHDSSLVDMPIEVNLKLSKDDGDLLPDPRTYQHLVGSFVYLTITRPDTSYAVNLGSQFMTAPRRLHLTAVKRIIRYLLRTVTRGLYYPKDNHLHLIAYVDADWASYPDTRHLTTELQFADIFMKGLSCPRHQFLVSKLLLYDSQASI
ncbi:hypothetical protein AAC387_Pa06g1711 [Persea americana]